MWRKTIGVLRPLGLCCILLAPPVVASFAEQAEEHCRADIPLTAVLSGDEARSLGISYSSRMVTSKMRALGNPSGSFAERLSHWLSVYGLELRRSDTGDHLVARAERLPALIIGQVTEEDQPIPNVEIKVEDTDILTSTSASGCFVLAAPGGDQRLSIRAEGFQDRELTLDAGSWHQINLQVDVQQLLETVVVAGTSYHMMGAALSSQSYLNREQIERTPHIGDDITRAFRRLSGAASGDISPKLNVRGGAKDELVMVVDGLALHQPWYFKSLDGLVSIVDSNIISSVDFLSGGFTAEYGGKTSAITVIDTIPTDRARSMMGVSFMTAYGQTGGSFDRGEGGWFTSVRGGYLDIAFDFAGVGADVKPRYQDLFAKSDFGLGDHTQVALNLLAANDRITFDSGLMGLDREFVDDTSGNYNFWVHAETAPNNTVQIVNTLSLTDLESRLLGQYDQPRLHWRDDRHYRAWGLQSDWTTILHDNHLFKWGVNLKWLQTEYNYYLSVQVELGDDNSMDFTNRYRQAMLTPEGEDQSAYFSYRFRWFDALTTELGGRWSRQTYTDLDEEVAFSPRFNTVLQLATDTSINLSWGEFRQPQAIDELSPGDGDTRFHPEQVAEHRILGIRHAFNRHIMVRLDFYQKDYSQLLPRYENLYENFERFVNEAGSDRVTIAPERAEARGAELSLSYDSHTFFSAWANYSYSEVNDYINGFEIPRAWDQRHASNISLNWGQRDWSFNITGMYRSGWPTTPEGAPPPSDPGAPPPSPDFEHYQTERLGSYRRIDVRVMNRKELGDGSSLQYYLEIYNLLGTDNPVNIQGDSWLPRIPSIGVRYVF